MSLINLLLNSWEMQNIKTCYYIMKYIFSFLLVFIHILYIFFKFFLERDLALLQVKTNG